MGVKMRKVLLGVLLLVAACTSYDEKNTLVQTKVTVNAPAHIRVSSGDEVMRTTVVGDKEINWSAEESISYFPGVANNVQYRLQRVDEGKVAYFERVGEECVTGIELDCGYAVYPYMEGTTIANHTISLTLPTIQHYAESSFGEGANVMVAVSKSDEELQPFKSIGGYLKLQIYGSAKVKSIELRGNNGEKLSGQASVYYRVMDSMERIPEEESSTIFSVRSTSPIPILTMSDGANTSVALDCGEGVDLSKDKANPTPFWFVLPPVIFEKGFTITITDDNDVEYIKSTSKEYEIKRNYIQPMKAYELNSLNEDVEIVDGKARLYLLSSLSKIRQMSGMEYDWLDSKVAVNGVEYDVQSNSEGKYYVDVTPDVDCKYSAAVLKEESRKWFGTTPHNNLMIPYSQFSNTILANMKALPMFAEYSRDDVGGSLQFNDKVAMLSLNVKGSAKIASVKVENLAGGAMAGRVNYVNIDSPLEFTQGVDFVVLNCTQGGEFVQLNSGNYTHLPILLAPGDYSQGLRVTIGDSEHRVMFYTISPIDLSDGEVYSLNIDYVPDSKILFYEGFDNCVWGGDVMKGESGMGFAPDGETMGMNSGLTRTGYEEALTTVAYNNPGTGFIQSNAWDDVNGSTVGASHQISSSYVASRNFASAKYIYRTQEHPGYIAVGALTSGRGIYQTPVFTAMTGVGTVTITISFALEAGFNGELESVVANGGIITKAELNGNEVSLTNYRSHQGTNSALYLPASQLPISSNVREPKSWNTLVLTVENMSDASTLKIDDKLTGSGEHGIYIDSVEVRFESEWQRNENTLRVMMWNIQNGMWADQHNNYNDFVEWVKKWDPDVCIWCESESIYKDSTGSGNLSNYLPNNWGRLCRRYDHRYSEVGGNHDNYPQTVTSKYQITVAQKITDSNVANKPIAHGAGHFTITKNGKKINIVTMHMWPMSYGKNASDTETSTKNNEGDLYRKFEMEYIVSQTVNNTLYADEELWLLGGDTNAHSRLDNWYYKYAKNDTRLLTHDVVLNNTTLKDIIGLRYPNCFFTTSRNNVRIDILYASPKMYDKITNATILMDSWAGNIYSLPPYYYPSDHRPLLIDFDMSK